MIFKILVYALTGKLLIYLFQTSPYPKLISGLFGGRRFLDELFECDLCLGVWIFSILNVLLFRVDLLKEVKDEEND